MFSIDLNRRIRSRMYGGVRGRRYSYLLLLDLMKEKSDGTGKEDGDDEGADPADGDPGIRCNGYAASRLNAICSTHGISEDLLYDHFSVKDDLYLA